MNAHNKNTGGLKLSFVVIALSTAMFVDEPGWSGPSEFLAHPKAETVEYWTDPFFSSEDFSHAV
ncbi:MAG: hypothetical protein PHP44_11605 [Kiritimatiellae bacterium]|nr:hypothetical protein [Kiritimatiellia bacterium]